MRLPPRRLALLCVFLLAPFAITKAQDAGVPKNNPVKPLKVFILAGQSNMQGHAHVRTIDHLGMAPETTPLRDAIVDSDGKPKLHQNIWVSYLTNGGKKHGQLTTGYGASGDKIGPELTFGIEVQKTLDEPILIVKTAWGGKSLHTDFRPPSAPPYQFQPAQLERFEKQGKDIAALKADKSEATGRFYRLMIDHIQKVVTDLQNVFPEYDASAGYELAGFVWFQGWNDMVDRGTYPHRDQPGGYDEYSKLLAQFIRDVRKDLDAPALPFVIGVMGVGGPVELYTADRQRIRNVHQFFRDAMAAPAKDPEFRDTVAAVLTEKFWDPELVSLRTRENRIRQTIRQRVKDGELDRSEEKPTFEKLRGDEFTDRELETLRVGISNAEYHYLGSAKIMALIGQEFARTLLKLMDSSAQP